jgi:hypothetical protein
MKGWIHPLLKLGEGGCMYSYTVLYLSDGREAGRGNLY